MKKLLLLFAVLLTALRASAYDFEVDGIYYNVISDTDLTCEVTDNGKKNERGYPDGSSYSGDVTIPSTVTYSGRTFSVTSIEYWAFYGCYGLTSVEIPNSVTEIGMQAFSLCSGLTSVEIPNSVTKIGNSAFYGCSGLNSFSGKFATEDHRCLIVNEVLNSFAPSGLTSYDIPNSVKTIGSYAFSYCTGLTSVEIPNSVTEIGSDAFSYCSGLTSVVIPNSVTSIGEYAFSCCSGLTSVEIPNSVTTIGNCAFYKCMHRPDIGGDS